MYVQFCFILLCWNNTGHCARNQKTESDAEIAKQIFMKFVFQQFNQNCQFWMTVMYTSYKHRHMFMLTSVVHLAYNALALSPVLYSGKCYGF